MYVKSLTLMICTYQRPLFLKQCLHSVGRLRVPHGIEFHVVVSDNNPVSQFEAYIGEALAALPFPSSYGHARETGYSSARNTAIEVALETAGEIFAFIDDDFEVCPDWLAGHVESYAAFDCDAVAGVVDSSSKCRRHGARTPTAGMANFSFKRQWVESNGINLRFDPRFNLTGYEDRDFTQSATNAGQVIVFSDFPKVHDQCRHGNLHDERVNKAEVAVIAARNKIVRLRQEARWGELAVALGRASVFGWKAMLISCWYIATCLFSSRQTNARVQVKAWKEFNKMTASFGGLSGGFAARQAVRRAN